MKLVREYIENFMRGGNVYKKMGIGSYKEPEAGDVFISNVNLYLDIKNQNSRIYTTGYKSGRNILVLFTGDKFTFTEWGFSNIQPTNQNRYHSNLIYFDKIWFKDNRDYFTKI